MQALWSRAGQAHHCGCKACFNAAGGMMRQSATRATPRKPTFSEIFTACYTGIMGTAAVLDAKAKDRRRLDLERQLEEAREELDNLKRKRPQRTVNDRMAAPGDMTNRYRGATWDHRRQNSAIAEFLDSLHSKAEMPIRSGEVDYWWDSYGLTNPISIARINKTNYKALCRSIVEEERIFGENTQHRNPKTNEQLELLEKKMSNMVSSILRTSRSLLTEKELKTLHLKVEPLRRSRMPCWDRISDDASIKRYSETLNSSLDSILRNPSYTRRQKISRVCHNLLVSTQPVTTYTYNTLILGFNRAGLHELANVAVRYFFASRREPTRGTLVCLLHHYKEAGEEERFYRLIQRMTGQDPDGIHIRRKFMDDVLETEPLRWWATVKDVAIHNEVVVERARFDADVLKGIIAGMLRFSSLRHAVATWAVALDQGVKFSSHLISALLHHCLYALDTDVAKSILKVIEHRPSMFEAAARKEEIHDYLAWLIQSLLHICNIDRSAFSVAPWLQASESALPSKEQARGLRIISIMHQLNRCEKKIAEYETEIMAIESGVFGKLCALVPAENPMPNQDVEEALESRGDLLAEQDRISDAEAKVADLEAAVAYSNEELAMPTPHKESEFLEQAVWGRPQVAIEDMQRKSVSDRCGWARMEEISRSAQPRGGQLAAASSF